MTTNDTLAERGGWQPIETAPVDDGEALVGVWVFGPDHEPYWASWVTILDGGPLGCDGLYGDAPTHFTRVPPPSCPARPASDRLAGEGA